MFFNKFNFIYEERKNKGSKILIITICSNQKIKGGDVYDKDSPSIFRKLPEFKDQLLQKRYHVYNLIKKDFYSRDGIPSSEFEFNRVLRLGPDIGGKDSAQYMPDHERYAGSIFTMAKSGNSSIISETCHHVLIISGLYGLLLHNELIQAYSCHIDDHTEIRKTWIQKDFLTSLVLAYINEYQIRRVFDLTAINSYAAY